MDRYQREVKHQREVMNAMKDSYAKGRLTPFVGSGFSKNVEGGADWSDFIQKLSENLHGNKYYLEEKFKHTQYQTIAAQYFAFCQQCSIVRNIESHNKINSKIKKKLRSQIQKFMEKYDTKPSSIHRLLTKMFPYIFTTNWDKLLENNDDSKKFISIYSIYTYFDSFYKNSPEKLLIKIHGSYEHAASMVITEEDYYDIMNMVGENYPLNLKFQSDCLMKDFIFVGFSFSDININNLLYPITKMKRLASKSTNKPKIFLIYFGKYDEILADFYKKMKDTHIYFIKNVLDDDNELKELNLKYLFYQLMCDNEFIKDNKIKEGKCKKDKNNIKKDFKNILTDSVNIDDLKVKDLLNKIWEKINERCLENVSNKIEKIEIEMKLFRENKKNEKLNAAKCKECKGKIIKENIEKIEREIITTQQRSHLCNSQKKKLKKWLEKLQGEKSSNN